jgi:hypothetical protein
MELATWSSVVECIPKRSHNTIAAVSPGLRRTMEKDRVEEMPTLKIRKWWLETLAEISLDIAGSNLQTALDMLTNCRLGALRLRDATDEHLKILAEAYEKEMAEMEEEDETLREEAPLEGVSLQPTD